MLILSQDKTETTENLELKIDEILKENGQFPDINTQIVGYCIVNKKYNTVLGEYATEERAKEVLQEIIEEYKSQQYIVFNAENGECEQIENKRVYEMPEK